MANKVIDLGNGTGGWYKTCTYNKHLTLPSVSITPLVCPQDAIVLKLKFTATVLLDV